ncbi:hypothetical protein LSH36_276g01010 [Paralvinella palmiformis]|uniref:PH domain-containing protein n=1 Tax=Paralvinella palmiformis TaxID=53620 RepID=A0AAD9N2A8_9ANNE|nr:hypothetical protein LSH36_276g01010 [Paralvinella palmiformis]
MPYLDKDENVCGFLDIEEKEASNIFLRRFFMLDRRKGVLKYYMDNPQVGDARRLKPKESFAFYFTFAGKNVLLRADNSTDKEEWIRILNESTKVAVISDPDHSHPRQRQSVHNRAHTSTIDDSGGSYQVEVFGDIILKTEFPAPSSDRESNHSVHSNSQSWNPYSSQYQVIKKGYAVKQGLVEKEPIKVITLADVIEARVSVGIHLNKEHVLEVVTGQRVFYMETETAGERDSWIVAINHCVDKLRQPRPVRADDYCPCDQLPRTVLCRTSGYRNLKYPSMPIRNCDYFDNESSMNKNTLDKPEPCSCSEKARSSILCIRL